VKAQKFFEFTRNRFYAFTQINHKFWFGFSQNTFVNLQKSQKDLEIKRARIWLLLKQTTEKSWFSIPNSFCGLLGKNQ
jgi:hypothetical protein